jgi:hypothetical protein
MSPLVNFGKKTTEIPGNLLAGIPEFMGILP